MRVAPSKTRSLMRSFLFLWDHNGSVVSTNCSGFVAPLEINERDAWFQQNGVPVHAAGSTLKILQECLKDRHCKRFEVYAKLRFNAEWFFCGTCQLESNLSCQPWTTNHRSDWNNRPEDTWKGCFYAWNAGQKRVVPTLGVMCSIYCSFDTK